MAKYSEEFIGIIVGKKSIVWRYVRRLENTGLFCNARTVLESDIERILVTAINKTLSGKDTFLTTLQNNIESGLSQNNDKNLADIDKRLEGTTNSTFKAGQQKS